MGYIKMKTSLPGPRSQQLLSQMVSYVAKAKVDRTLVPAIIDSATGALVTDIDGNTWIDLAGGVGAMNVGHSHPLVVQAIEQASKQFTHTDVTVIPYESYVQLAAELCQRAPGAWPKKACFLNSGAEAVESAIKIAQKATGRKGIICFDGAFHGRTHMALSLTSKVKPYKEGLGPFSPIVYRAPYPYTYRWPGFPSSEQVAEQALELLEKMFTTQVSPEETAAVIIEPIQGEAGFIVPPIEYMRKLEAICRKHHVLLIADEVQTGYGRTGKFLASEHFGIEPDMIVLGKSIAAGLPLSGVIGRQEWMDAAGDGSIGGTFVGNPVACSAALAVLTVMDQEQLCSRAQVIGDQLRHRLQHMSRTSSLIGEIRGVGAMIAFELVTNPITRVPAAKETETIIKRCVAKGVILFKAGLYGNVIRFLVPLVITIEQLTEALDVLEIVLLEVEAEFRSAVPITDSTHMMETV